MSDPDGTTADELLRKLATDADYQKRRTEKAEHRARAAAQRKESVEGVLSDLKAVGVTSGLADLVDKNAPLSENIVNVLLKWLAISKEEPIREALIRALGAAGKPFDGSVLADLFDNDRYEEKLRFPIANTIAEARPHSICDWVVRAAEMPAIAPATRGMLFLALARLATREQSLPILNKYIDALPGNVAMALAEIGNASDLALLQSRNETATGWDKKEITKAIRAIEERDRKG